MFERRQYVNRHDLIPRSVRGRVAQYLCDLTTPEVHAPANLQAGFVDRKRCSEALWIRVAACERIGYEPSHEADSAPF